MLSYYSGDLCCISSVPTSFMHNIDTHEHHVYLCMIFHSYKKRGNREVIVEPSASYIDR